MNDRTDSELLRAYVERNSEPAFAEFVRRHVDFVHSAALRMVCDSHLAQDVTQGVFVALAKNAHQLMDHLVLSGWLHRTAQNIAAQTVRTDVRRRAREQEAAAMNELLATESDVVWEHIAPHLDAALDELNEPDRDALLLRYFECKSAREMAQTLGTSEDAAQKRVSRAVDRLREFFAKRGVTVGASGLVAVISTHAVQAAPGGLAVTISATTLATAMVGSGKLSLLKFMATTKLKAGVISTVILASVVTSVVIQQRSQAKLREAALALQQQVNQLAQRKAENERLSQLAALAARSPANNQDELQKLQKEVATLREQTNNLAKLQEEARHLQASLIKTRRDPQSADLQPTVRSEKAETRLAYSMGLAIAAMEFASRHQDRFPTNLAQVAGDLRDELRNQTDLEAAQFEIVYTGSRAALAKYAHPGSILLIREKLPWKNTDGRLVKVYVFSDCSGTFHSVADGDFETWENQHIVPSEPSKP